MDTIKPDGPATAKRRSAGKWLLENLWALVLAGFVAVTSVIIDRFSDEINAWFRSVLVGGVGGTYTLKTFTYPDGPSSISAASATVELKDGGNTVFGIIKSHATGAEYKLFGYHRVKFLLMSYGGKGPLGGGTLALQNDIASGQSRVFWGWRTAVECIGAPNPQSYLVECPAIMFLQGTKSPEEDYKAFLRPDFCRKATSHNLPELCENLKTGK